MRQKKIMKEMIAGAGVLVVVWAFCPAAWADRALERQEILEIFEALTSQPRKTWIQSGTIVAKHEEYKAPQTTDEGAIGKAISDRIQEYLDYPDKPEATTKMQQRMVAAIPFNVRYRLSNESTMVSNVIVRYDGKRFYWEISVESRVDSVKVPPELEGDTLTEEFDLKWNQRRVFCWDGEKYINYFRPGNQASISSTPGGVTGPLTAGVVPWGYGPYSLAKLSASEATGYETESDGGAEIHLFVVNGGKEETFILDPAKDYALDLYAMVLGGASMTVQRYGNYQLVGGRWCPGEITIARYDTTGELQRLLSRDVWELGSISNGEMGEDSFKVEFEYDALIEDFRFGEPLQYRYLPPSEPAARNVDVERLLERRLETMFAAGSSERNCATVALKHVCAEFGVEPSWPELGALVHGPERSTTLFEIREFLGRLGLSCLAVKTDLETLKALGKQEAILYLANEAHFVVLGNVDDRYVRLIDLDHGRFCYRRSREYFERLWGRTALVVDKGPITMGGDYARIDDDELHEIVGAGCTCTERLQWAAEVKCKVITPWICTGTHRIYYDRWGCEKAPTGDCSWCEFTRMKYEACIPDPCDPNGLTCMGDGNWKSSYMEACL